MKTYSDLKEHLLRTMDMADDRPCKGNKSITKEKYWNMLMGIAMGEKEEGKLIEGLIFKNALREFPKHY